MSEQPTSSERINQMRFLQTLNWFHQKVLTSLTSIYSKEWYHEELDKSDCSTIELRCIGLKLALCGHKHKLSEKSLTCPDSIQDQKSHTKDECKYFLPPHKAWVDERATNASIAVGKHWEHCDHTTDDAVRLSIDHMYSIHLQMGRLCGMHSHAWYY